MRVRLVYDHELHGQCQISDQTAFNSNCDCGIISGRPNIPTLAFPVIYSIELTTLCNNRCSDCGNVFLKDTITRRMPLEKRIMSFEYWRVILDTIAPFAQGLKITGGEATLHPEFKHIINYIQTLGIEFSLLTNGRWVNPEETIALLKSTPVCIGMLISLHGVDAATHDAFTGIPGSFYEATQNIRRSTSAGLVVHTNTVLTRQNYNQVEGVFQLSQALGAKCAVFNRLIGQQRRDFDLQPSNLRLAVHEVDRLGQKSNTTRFGTCIPLCFVDSSSTGCLAGTAYCTIDPWGNIRPCNHAPQIIGNLLVNSLDDIWQSAAMETWRSLIPNACSACSAFKKCHGGCRAEMILRNKVHDPLMSVPLEANSDEDGEICLYEHAIPELKYLLREEIFGSILFKGGDIIPLNDNTHLVISTLSQRPTLLEIQQHFGDDGVNFIGLLYQCGAVSLHW